MWQLTINYIFMSELGGKPGVKTQQEKPYLWPNIETNFTNAASTSLKDALFIRDALNLEK